MEAFFPGVFRDKKLFNHMVRKLLKKKLLVVNLKKLKTVKHAFTFLGNWAKKQFNAKCSGHLWAFHPKNSITSCALQRKPVIDKIINNFSHVKSSISAITWLDDTVKNAPKLWESNNLDSLDKLHKDIRTGPEPRYSMLTSEKRETQATVNPRKTKLDGLLGHLRHRSSPSQLYTSSSKWIPYKVELKSQTKTLTFNNWKNLYSLESLTKYQQEKTFIRRNSYHKKKLIESYKVTNLYGKFSKITKTLLRDKNHIASKAPILLEKRLDVALKRCFMFTTLRSAHNWISQGRIRVNGRIISTPSYLLNPGDVFSIGKEHRERFKWSLLKRYYKFPRLCKYIQSGLMLKRWKEWAFLYTLSKKHYYPYNQSFSSDSQNQKTYLYKSNIKASSVSWISWPDRGIKNFWYSSGRYGFKLIHHLMRSWHSDIAKYLPSGSYLKQDYLIRCLAKQRWPRMLPRFTHWKLVYRRRINVFSQWLLRQTYLICDGLYFLRWHRAFIRKKHILLNRDHRKLALGKPLQYEVSYKNYSAIYLYPPQRILWPYAVDFRKI